jgi:hypothetical protein
MEIIKKLVETYKSILVDVPQDKSHHPEGDVFVHSKLVRKSVNKAIAIIQSYKWDEELSCILDNLDLEVNDEERKILFLTAWLHDLGKSTATTVDKIPFREASTLEGKIQAIEHERPQHYGPQIDKLKPFSTDSILNFFEKNKEVIEFLIKRHMDFAKGGFSKRFIAENFKEGKLNNDNRLKLLLMLKWADQLGRNNAGNINKNVSKLIEASKKSINKSVRKSTNKKVLGEKEFVKMLVYKGLDNDKIKEIFRKKFSKELKNV